MASNPTVVISDSFDDGDLTANNATGNGFNLVAPSGNAIENGGNLVFSVNGGGTRAYVVSNEAFTLTGGFTLSFDYNIAAGGNPSNTLNFALVDDPTQDLDIILGENTNTDAFGFGARPRNGAIVPGLLQVSNGSFNNNVDSNQTVTDNASVVITVDENLNYTYSVNGAAASTGTLSGFDLNEDYYLVIAAQGLTNASVGSVMLQLNCLAPALVLGSPFQDRVVLQRDKPINIWGTSEPGSAISVAIAGHNVSGTTDTLGNWLVELPGTAAGGGSQILTVTSTSTEGGVATRTVNDVLYGDIWFCFGQSNMRWRFSNFNEAWETFYTTAIANNDNIRYLRTIEDGSLTEQETTQMSWLDNSSVNSWSAVASVFAYQVHQATGVPVAIIDSAWGSSSIEGWMPRELENDLPHFNEMLDLYQDVGEFRAGTTIANRVTNGSLGAVYPSNEEAIAALSGSGFSNGSQANIFMRTRPNIIYNERVHPLRKFGIAGFVWYQGEANGSNVLNIAQYQFSLPRFVEEYRERFGQGDLPFLGVQLPSFNAPGPGWQWFRESQDSLLDVPNAYLAITLDTGESDNIHPSDKEEVGVRLSLLAREHIFGENIEGDSPRFASQAINGNQVIVTFDNAAGLTTDDGASPDGFEVAGNDGVFHNATSAVISGNTITVSSTAEPAPVYVRYAWEEVTHTFVNVINGATQPSGSPSFNDQGLPLAPFRTDSLPVATLTAQAPFAVNDSYSVPRDEVLSIEANGVLANDFDLNLNTLEVTLVSPPSSGNLNLQLDGSFIYTPEEGFAGEDSFTYQTLETDGNLSSEIATVTITVEGVPSNYYLWRQTIDWLAGQDQTTGGDPDFDGVTNFLEFALDLNPLVPDSSGLPSISRTATGAEFHFNNAQTGVAYEVLISTDLQTWSDPPFASLDNTEITPVVIPASEFSEEGRLFTRLRISESSDE